MSKLNSSLLNPFLLLCNGENLLDNVNQNNFLLFFAFSQCEEEYTKAADVYSFGIIAYEIVTGPPYPDIPHDKDLAMKICNGL
ncbi:hypothetical protein Glove_25g19 [Diversispora epigaea]|uniref:Serine-threonine/tyrosine-protein kinase catalytic domain-containing protein n=1 Tax=Diversispora epigaea TaxID=1348612 RepID=A0A397JIP2_9GLOM|nr:hypothetical protein Glove_25g19 [Diversispora epigaea]